MTGRAGRPGRRRQGGRPAGLRGAGATDLRRHLHPRLRLTGNEEDARDVVQEAYLRAYRGLKRFRGDAQFTTWLYRITANCAADQLRRRRRHRHEELDEDLGPIVDADHDPAALADAADLRDRRRGRPRRAAAPAAGGRRAPRRLRPAPRGDRRRARASPSRRPRSASTGPGASCAGGCSPAGRTSRTRSRPMRCDDIGEVLRRRPPTARSRSTTPPASTSSSACAARPSWSSTASCSGPSGPLRTEVLEPAPGPARRDPGRPRGGGRAPRRPVAAERAAGSPTSAASRRPPRPAPAPPSCSPPAPGKARLPARRLRRLSGEVPASELGSPGRSPKGQ